MNDLYDIALEKEVLCILINFPKTYNKVAQKLSESVFTTQENKRVFNQIASLAENNRPYDLIIISRELERTNPNDSKYVLSLSSLSSAIPSHIERYVMYLVELTVKRDFLTRFSNLINIAKNSKLDIFELREKAYENINNLFLDNFIDANRNTQSFESLIDKVQKNFLSIIEGNEITGIKSSIQTINQVFGGWQNTNLTILAGRPGMGKSSFMVQQIVDVALQNKSVGVFSLEMSDEQIASKILTNITEIPNSSILRKGLNQDQIKHYFRLKEDLAQLPIHIDDTPAISIQDLKIKSKMMKNRFGIEILMIDYLQLIRCKAPNREQEVSKISQGLKAIAKELEIPVIALSQLSRNVETRGGSKRPFLSDLRDSGSIEQDADEVIFLYRPEYYGIEQWDYYDFEPTKNEIELIIAKNRHGGILSSRLKTDLPTSKFMNLKGI